jgi:hypothetical protein
MLWFQRFGSWLTLAPSKRSLLGAYKAYMMRTEPDRYPTLSFSRAPDSWYSAHDRWNWQSRAIAYDVAQHEDYLASIEDTKRQVKEECKEALLTTLRKCMQTIELHNAKTMSLQGAVYAVPRIMTAVRDFFGFDQTQQLSLDMIMAALPAHLRSQVLANIRIGQVNITVNQAQDSSRLPSQVGVVEGEIAEPEP